MTHPIRVAHFIETGIPGGAEQVLLDLCEYARDTGNYDPVLVTFEHSWFAEQCRKRQIEYYTLPFRSSFKRTTTLPIFAIQFARWLRLHQIDLLHSHLFGPVTGGAPGAFLARIPHVGTLHDIYMVEEKPGRIHLLQLAALLRTRLVTVSKNMEQFYRARTRFSDESIRTIYNGIEPASSPTVPTEVDAQPVSGPDPTIICVGRLIPLKQVDRVLAVVIKLLKRRSFNLVILGEGPEQERLAKQVPADCADHIRFLGSRDDVRRWLATSDIFVQYSLTEGLSRSILEALAAGLPCVVSDVGGNRELVEDRVNGRLVSAEDLAELEDALAELLDDPQRRQRMGQASRTHAEKVFDRKVNNDKYLALYRELAKPRV